MSTLKVNAIRQTAASSDAVTLASDGTCTAKITNQPPGNRNLIINGAMVIDQRKNGASSDSTGATYLSCDRFKTAYAAASKFTMQQVASTLSGFPKALKVTSAAATTASASQHYVMEYNFEGYDVAPLALGTSAAKTFTLSFYVKSSLTGNFSVSFNNGADNRTYATTYNIASAATWERKTITVAGDTTGTWTTDNTEGLAIKWDLGSGSNFDVTANTWSAVDKFKVAGSVALIATNAATLEITGVQLEVGDVATDFEHRSYADELARCQRYYEGIYMTDGTALMKGYASYNSNANFEYQFAVQKRARPTWSLEGNASWAGATPNAYESTSSCLFQVNNGTLFSLGDAADDLCGSFSAEF